MVFIWTLVLVATACPAFAATPAGREKLRGAIERAIPLLEKSSAGSADNRTCFTCHHQALPVMALHEARGRGLAIDEQNFRKQVEHTRKHLERGRANYERGKGQGGQVLTAGYALWALEAGGEKSDELTTAVVHYLLERQSDQTHWSHPGSRPPSSGSEFATTYVAARALLVFADSSQEARVQQRLDVVKQWLQEKKPQDTEDQVFRLRLANYLLLPGVQQAAVDGLITGQREDGGWGQLGEMPSDAYATATAVVALQRTLQASSAAGDLRTRAVDAIRRGVDFLLAHQQADGTWHVKTRAKPIQAYFETGFPYEKDQFISTSATAWSVIALCLAMESAEN